MFLSPTSYDAARIWTPCVDSLWERCTWEIEVVVPRFLEGEGEVHPVVVIASGELIEQVTHPHDSHKVVFYFIQTNAASVQHMSLAAGAFHIVQVPSVGESQKPILAFGLPGQAPLLGASTAFVSRAMAFYTTEFGSYPFTAFKMVFVTSPRAPCVTAATMAIVSSDLLHPADVIDQAVETRRTLSLALVQQWVGVNIIQRTVSDTWLIAGLALYLHGLFIRHLLGNNEYRFRLKKDIDRCVRMDNGDQWPICIPGALEPPDAPTMAFISLKAPLVLHILDRHITKSGTSLGLARVIPKILLDSLSDELPGDMLSTAGFFRTCRKVSGMDLQAFQDQWIYGSGCPTFAIKATFTRKKFLVELQVHQQQPAAARVDDEVQAWKRPVQLFEGSLTVRIHEADGAPFEHLVDVKQPAKTFQLPFNTKYKRTKRSGRVAARFNRLQAALDATEEEVDEEQSRDIDRSEVFTYPPWEDDEERRRWRVADWTDDEVEAMVNDGGGGGYEWIRIDPDCEWIASFDFYEKPWYWISQLQGDRDVVAQLEAIGKLTKYPLPVVASELARTVLVENYFYRVRMEAARALVVFNTAETDYIGHFLLLKLFQTFYCHGQDNSLDPTDIVCRPRPNDFSNFASYFLKKSIITALSELRDPSTRMAWRNVRQLLFDLVRLNDNMSNEYSDSHYLASIIAAMSNAFTAGAGSALGAEDERKVDGAMWQAAQTTIDQALTIDRSVPSYHNLVSIAALQAQVKATLAGLRTNDVTTFLSYTREGNYEPVRLAAFDCLLLCKAPGRSQPLTRYIFDVLRSDNSLVVRRHVAQGLHEALLMTLAMGEVHVPSAGVVEDDGRKRDEHNMIVKALRKDCGLKPELSDQANRALLSSYTALDLEVHFGLLKLAEVMGKAVEEPTPGTRITIQTPVVETPIATPKIRLSMNTADIRPDTESMCDVGLAPTTADYFQRPTTIVASSPGPSLQRISLALPTSPSAKKKKNAPKAQSRGLSDSDFKVISIVLQKLESHSKSFIFQNPVDPIRDGAPDYLTIVKQPMDLSTVRAKFGNGIYASRGDFHDDIVLIISNCYLYNPVGSHVRAAGEAFEKFFNSLWVKTENTLNNANQPTVPAAPPVQTPGAIFKSSAASMPPPPVPAPVMLKLKTTPTITIPPLSPSIAPMAPPPVPRRLSITTTPSASTSQIERKKEKKQGKGPASALDDLLSNEVDLIERDTDGRLESMLAPPPKKVKIAAPSTTVIKSPEKKANAIDKERKVKEPERERDSVSESRSDRVDKPDKPMKIKIKSETTPLPAPPLPAPSPTSTDASGSHYAPPPCRPNDLPPTVQSVLPFRQKRAKALVAVLAKDPSAFFFLQPVDPVRDGCPTYFDEIKEPSDYVTIGKKIDTKKYKSMGQLARDIELIFVNCRQFNPPGDITAMADANERTYWQEWPKAVSSRMTPDEKKAMINLLRTAIKEESSFIFREAVDPIALNIPQYFEIIPREDARDLSLIRANLEKGRYSTARQVDDDVELMLENARVFNGEGEITDIANRFGKWWKSQRARMDL
ncbi:hypothetical protein Q5752_000817 [Cryptotrichosporon argae]